MKPIKLILSAFGSYGDVQEISFTHRQQGLFLIAGDTGSGKSTIFDGIIFALYDTMSGRERKSSMMRSEYARESTETFVEYTFSYSVRGKEDIYIVRRYPSYLRKSRRRNKEGEYSETRQRGKVSLIMPDGKEYSGKAVEVNRKIEEIIGLTGEQFSKIAMIAQGEFQELIMDKTGKRKEIFQQIFNTQIYEKIEKQILERYKAEFAKQKENASQLTMVMEGVRLTKDSCYTEEWKEAIQKIDTQPDTVNEIFEGINKEISDEVSEETKRTNLLQEQVKQLDLQVQKGKELNTAWKSLVDEERNKKRLDEDDEYFQEKKKQIQQGLKAGSVMQKEQTYLTGQKEKQQTEIRYRELKVKIDQGELWLKNFEKEHQTAQVKFEKEYHHLEREHSVIQGQLPDYQRREQLRKEISQLQVTYRENMNRLEDCKTKYDRYRSEQEELKILLAENKDCQIKYEQSLQMEKNEKKRQEQFERLKKDYQEYRERSEELINVKKLWEKSEQEWKIARRNYEEANRKYIAGQAGYLAQKLEEGCPCPVCGSKKHPSPFVWKEEEKVSEHMLENLGEAENQTKETLDRMSQRITAISQEKHTAEVLICQNGSDLFPDFEMEEEKLPQYEKELKAKVQSCRQETKRLQETIHQQEERQKRLEQLEVLIVEQQIQREEANQSVKNAELQRKIHQEEEQRLRELLSYNSYSEANCRVKEIEGIRSKMKKEKDALDQKRQEERERLEGYRGSLVENQERLLQLEEQGVNNKEEFYLCLKESGYRKGKEWTEKEQEEYRQAVIWNGQIGSLQQECEKFDKQRTICQAKMETLKQQIAGRDKVDLEELSQRQKEVQEQYQSQNRIRENLYFLYRSNHEAFTQWKKRRKEREGVLKQLATIRSLNDAANGKIHFQTYVQRQYFNQIIYAANKRLAKMNSSQFLLKCREIGYTGQGEAGLDLDVVNPVSGKVRDVHTLSGGETFMASLAMALGMADVVQSAVGSTHLKTMFIDEGFGSLSEDVRNLAVRVLLELAGSNRLVGVISHVSELKEQIPDKLIITKDNNGSIARWELD